MRKVRTPEPEAFRILEPVIGSALARAVIALRSSKGTQKPFDAYRARLTLEVFRRASDPRLSAWEYINRRANRDELTQDYLKACVNYDPETGIFTARLPACKRSEGDTLGTVGSHGYLAVTIAGKSYLAHRLAWFFNYGRWPAVVDHIDRDRHNNRLSNLRECTPLENAWNATPRAGTVSGIEGVNWFKSRGKWVAKISFDGRHRTLGYFDNIADAAAARSRAVDELRGEFLNSLGGHA